jgi:hypothetical protein
MKFEEVLPALREGKRVRRKAWEAKDYVSITSAFEISDGALLKDDWEIVKEKVKKTVWVNVFQGSFGFVTDGIHDSRVDAALTSCQFDMPHLGIYSIEVEVEE